MVISSNVAVQPNEIVSVPISFGSALRGTNTLAVHIAQTNGEPDDYPDNDESLTNFTLEQTDFFTLTVQSDHWANEFEWSLKDDQGETLMGSPLDGYRREHQITAQAAYQLDAMSCILEIPQVMAYAHSMWTMMACANTAGV